MEASNAAPSRSNPMDAIVESIHAQLDMLLVQHLLLSDAELLGIARRIHYTLMARGLDIRQSLVTQAPVAQAGSQEM